MKLMTWAAFALFLSVNLQAQNYDFGKVSKAELQEQVSPIDSTAEAAILYKKERIYFVYSENVGFTQNREVHMRIKIYNKEGFEWANKKVLLYDDGDVKERIKGLRGVTYNLKGNKIKKDKMNSGAVFEEKVSEITRSESFTLPNVKEGSVIEYKYSLISELAYIDDIFLQYNIPMNRMEISLETPDFYSYRKVFNPKGYFVPKYTELKKGKSLTTTRRVQDARVGGSGFVSSVGSGTSKVKSDTDYMDNVMTIKEENVLALKAESYSGNINNYRAKLNMELLSFNNSYGTQTKSFSTNWEKVCRSIYDSQGFGGQLNKTSFFKDELANLIVEVTDPFQKAVLVNEFVKSKVKWNGIYGKYAQKGIRKAYSEGSGNAADINLLLVSMLQSVNVEAVPVLVSTANNGIPLLPTINGFNYVIVMVKKGDSYMLLDATEPYSVNNVLPRRALNWKGRAVYKDKSSNWVEILPQKKSMESILINIKFDEDLIGSGSVKHNRTDYLAMNYRNNFGNISEEDHIKKLESGKGDIEISELSFENSRDPFKPLKVSYNYELIDGIDQVGDQLYINPLLFLVNKENPFKRDERKYPIDFVYPIGEKYKINIMLPEGYKVESLPQGVAFSFKDSAVKFVYRIRENGQYLQLSTDFQINSPVIQPSDYKEFKQFYSKVVEKQQEQVVLSKIL